MDIVHLHENALDETARLVDGVTPDQMDLPTPCSAWDVRTLLSHLVGGNYRWAALARGEPMRRGPEQGGEPAADPLGDDPAGAYRRSAGALARAWRDPALLDQSYALPIGVLPGRAALTLRLVETVIHGWDLARATEQQPAFDSEVVETALHFTESNVPAERPPNGPFAPPVALADDRPEIDRLAALLGRTP